MVAIILSSYNGEAYIREQLDSILGQTLPDFRLLIRDDGSSDCTREILADYAARDPRIRWYAGENIGVQQSFYELLGRVPARADWIAFADQDDVWLPRKLERALQVLEGERTGVLCSRAASSDPETEPVLYCGAKQIVDRDLQPIPDAVRILVRKLSFGNALVQNIATGCTCLINRSLANRILADRPGHAVMHDWWLYLLGTAFGSVYYDEQPMIRYRQHGDNTAGAMVSAGHLWSYRFRRLFSGQSGIYAQLAEFARLHGEELQEEDRRRLQRVLETEKSRIGGIAAAMDPQLFRQKRDDDLVLRLILILGKL